MKKIYYNIIFFSVQLLAAFFVSQAAFAQQNLPDFSAEIYREAIQNIVRENDRFNHETDVFEALDKNHNEHLNPLSGFRGDTIITNPVIAFIEYNENSVTFEYIPTGQLVNDTVTVDIPAGVNWLSNPIVDKTDSTITISASINSNYTPNTATITVTGEFGVGNFVSCEATILQGPAPQPFILVSPKYQAVAPQGGLTSPFTVTSFNVDAWTADFSENWIHVNAASLTDESITFDVDPNDSGEVRDAKIFIVADGTTPELKDSLTIFQYVDTSNYIIATPSSSFINSGATPFLVNVNANISWKVEYTDVPSGMIDDSIVNAGSVTFNISQNSSSGQRTAKISLTGISYPDVSAQIQIVQSGIAPPYIYVSPANSYVGSEASSIILNVDANVNWETDIYNDPFNMLTEGAATQTTKIINVVPNTGSTSRMAEGRIKKVGSQMPADTFRIIQEASYILLNPAEKIVVCEGEEYWVHITRYNVDSVVVDTANFFGSVEIFGNDSLKVLIPQNQGTTPRNDNITICSFENSAICEDHIVFQYACNQSYIVVTPKFNALPYEGGISDTYFVNTSNVSEWNPYFENPVSWITDTIIVDNTIQFEVAENTGTETRQATFFIGSSSNPEIFDSAVIFQDGAPAPILLASPREQVVGFEGNDSLDFNITYQNIDSWLVDAATIPEWINVDLAVGNLLSLDVLFNNSTETRQAEISIYASNDPLIKDSIYVFQYAIDDAYILAAPRSDTILFGGGQSTFNITTANLTGNLSIDQNTVPEWILATLNGNQLQLDVEPNLLSSSRDTVIYIFDSSDISVLDSVSLYQYAAPESYILASPRSDTVFFSGGQSSFNITTVNLIGNLSIDGNTVPEWISATLNGNQLQLDAEPNVLSSSRDTVIYIFDSGDISILDSVSIYQYAAPESYILASPRSDTVLFLGGQSSFNIATVNLSGNLSIDGNTVPEWISATLNGNQLQLDVEPNVLSSSRDTVIYIFDSGDISVLDSVAIYQYAAPESYILASPRSDTVLFIGGQSSFNITTVNLSGNLSFDQNTVPEWISATLNGNQLQLDVEPNLLSSSRDTVIYIFDSGDISVLDSVSLYQYATPESYILTSPRSDTVLFIGGQSSFNITTVNLSGNLSIDQNTVPEWISATLNGNQLQLDVEPNDLSSSRDTVIYIFDSGDISILDSVAIYQYATPESYILASPRSDTVLFSGGQSSFHIKAVDLTSNWTVDENTLPFWIPDYTIINDSTLVLNVDANISSSTLEATIRIIDQGNSLTMDSISIYQYAAPEKYLLAAPREQKIGHIGGNLLFEITPVNVDVWGVDESTAPEWVSDFNINGNMLDLTVDPNTTLLTREASIRIFADSIGSPVEDMFSVYQYSGLDHYLLASPRERKTGNLLDTLYFRVDTVNVSSWQAEVFGGDASWIEPFISGADTLGLIISESLDTLARKGSVRLFSAEFPDAEDIVDIYQYSAFEPYLILDRSYETISYQGGKLNVIFYSNLDSVFVEKGNQSQWYSILGDSIASYNDTIKVKVEVNPEAYLARSAYIKLYSRGLVDTMLIENFYFQQLINPNLNDIYFSGSIKVDTTGLENVNIILGEDTITSDMSGNYGKSLPFGWVGAITPLKGGFYFEPPNYVFETPQKEDNDTVNFTAFPIVPDVTFNIEGDTLAICSGEQINESSTNYPVIGVSGTFGPRFYKWFSIPFDPNLKTDSTSSPPPQVFSPEVTTTYYLILYNYGTSDTTSFTVYVNPSPNARNIEGPLSVCRNQAGVIYAASNFESGEYFSWQLRYQGNLIKEYASNIAVIDWDGPPGEYELSLYTYNEFSCGVSNVDVITVSNEEAPPKTIVQKKVGDNMLLCLNADVELFNYEWGWYTMKPSGELNEKYIIPDKKDWYCRLPADHTFNPAIYKYFVSLTFKDGSSCESVSFLDNNAPVGIDEVNEHPYKIFPNPTKGLIRLQFFNLSGEDKVSCSILNASGQVMYSNEWEQVNPAEILTINKTEGLRPGIYIFRAEIGNKLYNSKIVVQ